MAKFLYRVGRFAFEKRRLVVLLWLGVMAALVVGAASAPSAPPDTFSIPGTESQQAFDLLAERFPGAKSDGAQARIVFVAPDGQQIGSEANKATVEKIVSEVAGGTQVKGVLDPFQTGAVSKSGTTAYATVSYGVTPDNLTDASKTALTDAIDQGKASGVTVEVGGSALMAKPEMGGATEAIGIAIAAIVLMITFGAFAAAGLPLLTALIGVGVGIAAIVAIGMSTTTTTLAMMLGLAVGIDYALFIVSRYRTERAEGFSADEAAGRAVGTAGSAVVFAGLTVVIALAGLAVVGIPALTKMGLAAAGTVAVAVTIALTLLPALLGFFQRAVMPKAFRKAQVDGNAFAPNPIKDEKPGMGTRWAQFVVRRPVAVLLIGLVGMGALALPMTSLELGMPGDEAQPTSTTQRRAYDALAAGFGPGFNGPLTVAVDVKGVGDPKAAVEEASRILAGTKGVVSVSPAMFNQAGDAAMLNVVPATGPSSTETKDLVNELRGEAADLKSATGVTMLVTGATAMNIDVSQKMSDALLPYLAVVVGLAILLLMVVFRSIAVPIKAALGFLLSVGAAFGVIVVVFQWGWLAELIGVHQTGPVMSMMPIFLIGVVFGLAMDYEVFLVTRMREAYAHGESAEDAIVTGFRHSGRVVVAAAAIMIAVFSGFIGGGEPMIKMMGLGLGAAVFFDAFIVRMTLVPAVLALLGDKAWWLPQWLAKILPNVDVEGESLNRIETVEPERELESARA
ncbi:MMPL family transporter [Nocardia sp. SYP-A9097]|uniref:MMPL family transporter n=1 Tax=Nocardia sp. SYP-A9097 TaxID=2663237 RepID=UPI00129A31D9|nr:MMPL family transporter [Nocardia sp. SYP-A9097]MRH88074.1 MMPL family transporter [Nocardia sp. SYP-A9097]